MKTRFDDMTKLAAKHLNKHIEDVTPQERGRMKFLLFVENYGLKRQEINRIIFGDNDPR